MHNEKHLKVVLEEGEVVAAVAAVVVGEEEAETVVVEEVAVEVLEEEVIHVMVTGIVQSAKITTLLVVLNVIDAAKAAPEVEEVEVEVDIAVVAMAVMVEEEVVATGIGPEGRDCC